MRVAHRRTDHKGSGPCGGRTKVFCEGGLSGGGQTCVGLSRLLRFRLPVRPASVGGILPSVVRQSGKVRLMLCCLGAFLELSLASNFVDKCVKNAHGQSVGVKHRLGSVGVRIVSVMGEL